MSVAVMRFTSFKPKFSEKNNHRSITQDSCIQQALCVCRCVSEYVCLCVYRNTGSNTICKCVSISCQCGKRYIYIDKRCRMYVNCIRCVLGKWRTPAVINRLCFFRHCFLHCPSVKTNCSNTFEKQIQIIYKKHVVSFHSFTRYFICVTYVYFSIFT